MKKLNISKLVLMSVALLCTVILPLSVTAGDYDGSKQLYCAIIDGVQCFPGGECQAVETADVNLPDFLVLNFKKKIITTTNKQCGERSSKIESKKVVDGKLMVQGAEDGVEGLQDGVAWSFAINESTGKMVLTESGEGVGFVFFGACTPQ